MSVKRKSVQVVLGLLRAIQKNFSRIALKCIRAIHRKKRRAIPVYAIACYIILVVLIIKLSGDSSFKTRLPNKRIYDVSAVNSIHVGKEIRPETIEEIRQAISNTKGKISIGGGRFSMGGQIAFENSLHIDMRSFNKVLSLDTVNKQVTVQPGIVWRDLQRIIDRYNFSIKIMQTYADFTVGGSISVNCHGRYIGHGPIVGSVLSIKLVTPSGEVLTANRQENPDLFAAAVGGYGGIGVIVEATLQLVDNVRVEREVSQVLVTEYNSFFNQHIRSDDEIIFQNGDLYPPHFDVVNSVAWRKTDKPLTDTIRVTPTGEDYWLEAQVMKIVSAGDFGKWSRRNLVDPYLYREERVVWRNREASYDVMELEPASRKNSTYVLQEYFIPVNRISTFIPKMKSIFDKYDVNVINVSIRHAFRDNETFLSWATEEVFAFVIYYKQDVDIESQEEVRKWTIEMTDAILSENGRWYLPYQPHATVEQFRKAYPQADKYFEVKNRIDPSHRFTNKLLDKYNPHLSNGIERKRDSLKGYYRDESQTFLTVPEWYLVFNPKEYADFLEAGNNPSDFPFYSSVDEYWTLYDRSVKLVSNAYHENEEYVTMLKVIGVSVTLEYTAKMLYENTIGRVFSWVANGVWSDEEKIIIEAHRAYSDFIYDKAWYEFEFMPWIKRVWGGSNSAESNWLRKVERKIFFTLEFAFKAGYAKLIEWGAQASYEEPITKIYLLASTTDSIAFNPNMQIVHAEGQKMLVSIDRWGAFTKTIGAISATNIEIGEIGGNDEIVVSVLRKSGDELKLFDQLLYESKVVTNPKLKRQVYLLNVDRLLPFVKEATRNGIEVEHVFDY